MKFAVHQWVRTKEMKITHITLHLMHPEYLKDYCA